MTYISNKLAVLLVLLSFSISIVAKQKPIILDPSYQHDKWNTLPKDQIKYFRAFTSSLDSKDDDNKDGQSEARGTPEWVSYEIRKFDGECIPTSKRPKWEAEKKYVTNGTAPKDNSYKYSKEWRKLHPDFYVRGHLQMKMIAARLGENAEANTHTFLNAVPQRSKFNGGIWLDLEYITAAWAQRYGKIWVMTGPIYIDNDPSGYIGEENEFKVAIPDALFKIIVKETENSNSPDVLAFIYPQIAAGYNTKNYQHERYLTSVDEIEQLTGLNFFTDLSETSQALLESELNEEIWNSKKSDFLRACKKNDT